MKGNVIVGQSGGPTAVINSSLAGVYKNAMERGYNKVYGMRYGIQGFIDEQYIDMSDYVKNELDLELLKRTPSAFLGTCRYKLPEIHQDKAVYERIFALLDKMDIEVFIYIGGNDSMDTIKKLSDYALLTGAKQKFVGCPKTIDNDLAITDHTPGFGSAAKYIAASTKEIIRDALGFSYKKKNVTIDQIISTTCEHFNVKEEDIFGKSRKAEIVTVRQLSMYLAHKHTKLAASKIGIYVGNRDHATVLHGIKAIDGRLKIDKKLQRHLEELEEKLIGKAL